MASVLRQLSKGVASLWSAGRSKVLTQPFNPAFQVGTSSLLKNSATLCMCKQLTPINRTLLTSCVTSFQQNKSLLAVAPVITETRRDKIYVSRHKGKPKSIKPVTQRFMRLNSGLWIRPRAGRQKKLWKKSCERKYRLRQHVFLNKQQCKLLDKMVEGYWKERKHYVDDIYEPYQQRYDQPQHWYKPPPFLP